MSRDTARFVAFESDQTRALAAQGWRLDIIDMHIWQSSVDGYISFARYVARGKHPHGNGPGTYGTMGDGDTAEQAVAALAKRIAKLWPCSPDAA